MKKLWSGVVAIVLLGSPGCSSSPATRSDEATDIIHDLFPEAQAAIRGEMMALQDIGRNRDWDALRAAHLESPKFTDFGTGFERNDFDQMLATEIAGLSTMNDFSADFRELKIDVFGDVAVATSFPNYTGKGANGERIEIERRATMVYVKTPNGWKIAHEHLSLAERAPVAERKGAATAPDGTNIHYSVRGQGPKTLVFVHGWSCDQSYWSEQAAGLADEFRIVTLDLAGHGLSRTSRSDWSIEAFGQDVIAVIEELNLDDVTLVGHSMGGMVMLEAAIAAPERVSAVIGVDTLHDEYGARAIDDLLSAMREDFATATEQQVRLWFPTTTAPELVDWVAADMAAQDPVPGIAALAAGNRWGAERMRMAIEELSTPLGMIQTSPFRRASTIVEEREAVLPALRFIELEGLSHFLMLEDPARCNAALRLMVLELADL